MVLLSLLEGATCLFQYDWLDNSHGLTNRATSVSMNGAQYFDTVDEPEAYHACGDGCNCGSEN